MSKSCYCEQFVDIKITLFFSDSGRNTPVSNGNVFQGHYFCLWRYKCHAVTGKKVLKKKKKGGKKILIFLVRIFRDAPI